MLHLRFVIVDDFAGSRDVILFPVRSPGQGSNSVIFNTVFVSSHMYPENCNMAPYSHLRLHAQHHMEEMS